MGEWFCSEYLHLGPRNIDANCIEEEHLRSYRDLYRGHFCRGNVAVARRIRAAIAITGQTPEDSSNCKEHQAGHTAGEKNATHTGECLYACYVDHREAKRQLRTRHECWQGSFAAADRHRRYTVLARRAGRSLEKKIPI